MKDTMEQRMESEFKWTHSGDTKDTKVHALSCSSGNVKSQQLRTPPSSSKAQNAGMSELYKWSR